MSDVKVTAFRDGSMSLNGFALDSAEVAALRAYFLRDWGDRLLAASEIVGGLKAAAILTYARAEEIDDGQ